MPVTGGRKWAGVYALIGAILGLGGIHHISTQEQMVPFFHVFSYAFISLFASGIIILEAYQHYRNPLPSDRYWRLNLWFFGGGLFIAAVTIVGLYIGSQTLTTKELIEVSRLMLPMGLAIGFLLGSFDAQSLESAEAEARAETLEEERERLRVLNDLLRHYVLNGVSVIGGYADRLESSTTGEEHELAAVINERSADMANIVNNLGVLTKTEWGEGKEVEADIGDSIQRHFSSFADDEMTLDIQRDLPPMVANVGFEEAMALFMEGICEAMEDEGTISVEGDETMGTISITIEPVDIPDSLREDLLEPVASGIGLELFLTKEVLEPAIELEFTSHGEETIEFIFRGEVVEPGT